MNRRHWMQTAAALAAAASLPRWVHAERSFASDPFSLGVASGATPSHDSVVLWTRLLPLAEPLPLSEDFKVRWELAADERFRRVLRQGEAMAPGELGHSVHVEVRGLPADRWFWYRFMAGGAVSAVGRTRSMPAPTVMPASLSFAFASCQRWEHGYYAAWRHMREESPDLVVFLGDYIYEYASPPEAVRKHELGVARSLADYRARYALYKSDPDLQAIHAACPWICTWDDHEVQNNYAGLQGEDLSPDFPTRRRAAYQAYYENMPLPTAVLSAGLAGLSGQEGLRLYQRYQFGQLARFHVLDDRQYRAPQLCPRPGRGDSGSVNPERCADFADAGRSLLGLAQERWLEEGLAQEAKAGTRWSVIAQQTLFSQRDFRPGPGEVFSTDGWDGYPAARQRLLDALVKRPPRNTVVIGGDVHQHYVSQVKADFRRADSPVIASEFCGTSISSGNNTKPERLREYLAENPHLLFADAAHRGYVSVRATPTRWEARMMGLGDVKRADSAIDTLARFEIQDGRPGAERA